MTELERITGPQHSPNKNPSFADSAQLFIDLHPDGEHGLYANGGPLDIRLFLSIQPTPAHRALAWLVRENLFSEVVTTNYDCALETAFQESFGEPPSTFSLITYRSICDHVGYRKNAATSHRLHDNVPTPVLRVYKINGCARHYHPLRKLADPGFLVITDRHLQDFGTRQWAHDLFRDRLRCRRIVFSGFGAEEPQVRFTALRVIEEFAQQTDASTGHCFQQVYDSVLSAAQLQIAKACSSIAGQVPDPGSAVFTKNDLAEFSRSPADEGLSASLFWQKLHRDVVTRLIARRLERCLPYYWLREHDGRVPLSGRVVQSLRQKLADDSGAPSAWLRAFLEGDPTLQLMRLAWHARLVAVPAAPDAGRGHYEPLDQVDSLPMCLLYLFHFLGLGLDSVGFGPRACGFWLRLPVSDAAPSDRRHRWVLVVRQRPVRFPEPPTREARIACCIIIGKDRAGRRNRRPVLYPYGGVTWRVLTLIDLIALAQSEPQHLPAETRFRRALLHGDTSARHPSLYAQLTA